MNKDLTALQALENIEKEIEDYEGFDENTYYQMDRTRFVIIKTSLKKQEQDQPKLKAFEIIKKKDFIDIKLLRKCKTHYEYNRQVAIRYSNRGMDVALLQEDEFDTLKEALL